MNGKRRGQEPALGAARLRVTALHEAGLEGFGQRGAVEVFADEDEGVGAGLGGLPLAVELGVEEHMHALEDEALVATLHGEHAFHAVDVAALYAEEFADPVVEFFAVEVAGGADADAGDGVVVRVRGVIILLPAGLRGFAHHLDVERVFAAGFEDEVETGSVELEDKRAVALGEKETVERGAGDDGVAVFEAGLPVGEDVDGGVARGGDCGEGGGGGSAAAAAIAGGGGAGGAGGALIASGTLDLGGVRVFEIGLSGNAATDLTISAVLAPAGVLGNYAITYNTANFTINTKAASVTPDAASKTYTISAAGYNIWYQRDEFHFLWNKMSGDVSLTASVAWPNMDDFHDRKVALVIRDSLDDDSRKIVAAQHGNGMTHIAWRAEKTGNMTGRSHRTSRQPIPGSGERGEQAIHPTRFGIEKKGDQFQLWISWQGEPIHPEGAPITFKTNGPVYVGIGFTSHLPANLLTAQVKDVVLENRAGRIR